MRTYSEDFKAQLMAQMLPPNHRGIPELARATGIPKDTRYPWRGQQRTAAPTTGTKGPPVASRAGPIATTASISMNV